jgi:hypothetical protein
MVEDKRVAWILRLTEIDAEGVEQDTNVMEINLPDDLGDLAHLGLTLTEAKLLLAGVGRSSASKSGATLFGPWKCCHLQPCGSPDLKPGRNP